MESSIVIGLIQNTAILLTFSMVYDYSWIKNEESMTITKKILTGFIIGFMGIVLMMTPWKMLPGIVFDTRSVLLSFTGLFFGFVPAMVAVIMTGLFRVLVGGDGVWMGIFVIITSGAIGLVWNKLRPFWKTKHYVYELISLGYAVHFVMLGCTLFLPSDQRLNTLKTIIIPLLTIYPAGTLLLGILMVKQNNNWQNRKALDKLRESERRSSEMLISAKIKAEESDKLKSIFLANMSHEIRTPMNAIMGFSCLLDDPDIEESEKVQYLEIIRSSGNRLMQLINDIIDISKLEAQQLSVKNVECDLPEIFINSIETFRKSELLRRKPEIKLVLSLPPVQERVIFLSDCFRLQQVLDNLISNAIKYTERGTVETGYHIKSYAGKPVIEAYVRDTGIGIPAEMRDLIFDRFRQVEEGRFHEGAGLGLCISKGIIELLGGRIWLESELNTGTTFYFSMPYNIPINLDNKTEEDGGKQFDLSGKNIIIADDDYNSFVYLKILLEGQNANISQAENGMVLLEMVEKNLPDLILLDISMPEMTGFEFLEEMHSRGLKTNIIAQTANAMPYEKEKCLQAGCNGYISKPFTRGKLFNEIGRILAIETPEPAEKAYKRF